ncbi:MAG: CapA family protein [Candidatus Sumerlaeota bacterium]|nr:CapA family protein [Candidatus Sumerlaeota bacterium]
MILAGDYIPKNKPSILCLNDSCVLCNLEGPILNPKNLPSPARKAGVSLYSTRLPDQIFRMNFSLANNHIMDFGREGLCQTFDYLGEIGANAAGSGMDLLQARSPMVVNDSGRKIGVISCCEAQFGVARVDRAGVAELGPWVIPAIRHLRKQVHAVVVSVHLALEMSPWPSPTIQDLYRSWIDEGASIVHGHHSHIPQGIEAYGNGIIAYGLGNFVVDPEWWNGRNTLWSQAVGIDWSIEPFSWQSFTLEVRQAKEVIVVERSSDEESASHRSYLEVVNAPLYDRPLLESIWQEAAIRSYFQLYADTLRSPSVVYRKLGLKSRLKSLMAAGKDVSRAIIGRDFRTRRSDHLALTCFNYFSSLSHIETVRTAMGVLAGVVPDLRTDASRKIADALM